MQSGNGLAPTQGDNVIAPPSRLRTSAPRLGLVAAATALLAGIALPAAAQPRVAHPVAAVSGQTGIGIRLLDASVTRRNDPRAHIYIDDFLAPGTTITRHVQVSDFTAKPVHLLMYAVASTIGPQGWQVDPAHGTNELTSWITVSPAKVDLAPGKAATVTVKISVPARASAGERYATVVAELPPPASAKGSSLEVATRVGVRVYLDVGSGGEPVSNFTVSTLQAARGPDGTPIVSAQVTNTGGRALDLGGTLDLSGGPGGLRAGPYDVQTPRTLGLHQTGDVIVALDKQTPVGPWLATMTLRSGDVSHTVTGHITFPARAGSVAKPVKAVPLVRNRDVVVPTALVLIALLAAALGLWWWRRRRRDDDDPAERTAPLLPSPRRATADEPTATRQ
jgi:hypothetical protein